MNSFVLQKPYDSHVHLFATGECAAVPDLRKIKTEADLKNLLIQNRRGDWIYGFGWDEHHFSPDLKLHRFTLDRLFGEQPVFFSRCDGHSSWLNTAALKKMGFLSDSSFSDEKLLPRDPETREPLGLLRESYHVEGLKKLPPWSEKQMKDFVLAAQGIFHRGGITHVREMTGLPFQFLLLQKMEKEGSLKLSVDFNFLCDEPKDLESVLGFIQQQQNSALVKIRGVKIFYDGSLGSETALLSQAYPGHKKDCGLRLWGSDDLKIALEKIFSARLEVCFHSIGDEATHQLVLIGRDLSQRGFLGRMNLEHVEVLRPETIQMMKSLHIRCHMQPVYWFSDRAWIKEKLGTLFRYAFPWEALRKAQIPLQFGSDAPIEPAGLMKNWEALQASAQERIPQFRGDFLKHHSCPYEDTVSSHVRFENGEIVELCFNGEILI